jgi:hypothetical protein
MRASLHRETAYLDNPRERAEAKLTAAGGKEALFGTAVNTDPHGQWAQGLTDTRDGHDDPGRQGHSMEVWRKSWVWLASAPRVPTRTLSRSCIFLNSL